MPEETELTKHRADAVFEGGGVKGIAHLGALSVMEKTWQFENVGGTSAGAIVAAFVACGMTAGEVRGVLDEVKLSALADVDWEDRLGQVLSLGGLLEHIPIIGRIARHAPSVIKDFGVYEGDRFVELMNQHLPPDKRKFGDIIYDENEPPESRFRYKLRVVASDVTAQRMLLLPQDILHFGRDPDELDIADALRMSMSIPIFFEPYELKDANGVVHHIVDGGVLSNYPIWMFDAAHGQEPDWPTFGFDLFRRSDPKDGHEPFPAQVKPIDNFVDFARSIIGTMSSAMDRRYIAERHWARTIKIDDVGVSGTDFELSQAREDALWESGVEAAEAFMNDWGDPEEGFKRWNARWRKELDAANPPQ